MYLFFRASEVRDVDPVACGAHGSRDKILSQQCSPPERPDHIIMKLTVGNSRTPHSEVRATLTWHC